MFYQQQLTVSDEVLVYLELCEAYCQLSRLTEAKELMQEAAAKFQGTPQEMRCVILIVIAVCVSVSVCNYVCVCVSVSVSLCVCLCLCVCVCKSE